MDALYDSYASTHAGASSAEVAETYFRKELAPRIPTDRNIVMVDVGCGQGLLVRACLRAGYANAWGIDISPEQVTIAHEMGVLPVQLGDFREMLRPGSQDVVLALDIFEHLKRETVVEALTIVQTSLRPGGLFIGRVPNAVSPFSGAIRHGDFTHETWFTPSSLRQLTNVAGFEELDIYPCEPPIHGIASALRLVLWKAIESAIKVAYLAETGQRHNVIITQNMAFVARAGADMSEDD